MDTTVIANHVNVISDSKVRLIDRLKVSRECLSDECSGLYGMNDQVIIKNQIAIMNALCDLLNK